MNTAARSSAGRTPAFTLVELLVVMTIIGVLIGVLLPALGTVMQYAENLRCQSNLRQIATSVMSYTTDHKGDILPTRFVQSGLYWCNVLAQRDMPAENMVNQKGKPQMTNQNTVMICPAATPEYITESTSFTRPDDNEAQGWFRVGNDSIKTDCSYYWNGYTGSDNDKMARYPSLEVDEAELDPLEKSKRVHNLDEIKHRSTLVMVADGVFWDGDAKPQRIAARHAGSMGERLATNLVYYDTHIERMDRYAPGGFTQRDWTQEEVTQDSEGLAPIMNRPGTLDGGPPYFMLPKR